MVYFLFLKIDLHYFLDSIANDDDMKDEKARFTTKKSLICDMVSENKKKFAVSINLHDSGEGMYNRIQSLQHCLRQSFTKTMTQCLNNILSLWSL